MTLAGSTKAKQHDNLKKHIIIGDINNLIFRFQKEKRKNKSSYKNSFDHLLVSVKLGVKGAITPNRLKS